MSETTRSILAGIIRHGIGASGAYLTEHGLAVSGSDMDIVSGAVMILLAIAWSAWHKIKS